jgi:hypothetical protein
LNQPLILKKLEKLEAETAKSWLDYWQHYSDFSTWQFWFILALFTVPLIFIWFFLDRTRPFYLGFYGFAVHIFFTYMDALGSTRAYWTYPYNLIPFLPSNIALDTSLVPTLYIFGYQWAMKHKKSYYLPMIIISAFMAFIFKPIITVMGLFQMHHWVRYYHLFFIYVLVGIIAKIIADVFTYLKDHPRAKNE